VIVIDDELMAWHADRDADVEPASLVLVPALLLDHDVAANDASIELVQLGRTLANASVERCRMRHVPNGDLQP